MHELPILRDIVKVALKFANQSGAERVVSINLQVGELRDLDEEWMQRYFNFVTAGTAAAGAVLRVIRSRLVFRCESCASTFAIDLRSPASAKCPDCQTRDVELVAGNELLIESIDVV